MTSKLFSLGVKGFAIRVKVEPSQYLKHTGRGADFSGDLGLIEHIKKIRRFLPQNLETVPEFQVSTDSRLLAPTIVRLYEEGIHWMVLNPPGEPSHLLCKMFENIFEYVKMRSCYELHLYFPFWNPRFKEWDIKTRNTFSGLRDVHIDLSNRCTHSCEFCPLYGPLAVEEMKTRGGGHISQESLHFMKLEMDKEEGLSIIKSLPWSVEKIQFGGAGDPLKHEDAIEFIQAARERGFKVSILSNMEYLSENSIKILQCVGWRS